MSNKARIIESLVSVDAWHQPFEVDVKTPLHVALSFSDARYTGDENNPVEFQVELKRATLVIICDENVSVPKSSIVRQHPARKTTVRLENGVGKASKSENSAKAGFVAKATTKNQGLEFIANQSQSQSIDLSSQAKREILEEITQTIEMVYTGRGTEHVWECQPVYQNTLKGSAHSGESLLMEIKPTIKKRLSDIGIRVFVKCKADDFLISDISLKKTWKEKFLGDDLDRRLRMAKAVIRHKLAHVDLPSVELDPKFQDVILADIMAVPE